MPGLRLETDAFILRRQPSAADRFEQLTAFSAEHGNLLVLYRIGGKKVAAAPLDLFDEAHLTLESSNQGQTWFLKDALLIARRTEISRNYEGLLAASKTATLIARNPVHEESREKVAQLLRQAFAAFA